uniref:Uncharacterized protein n=1 Tax=Rhizophagus irregularis (strain DAOM 181602 / DAOM 197198 / MUCL 43194) TaxID=747089 RepID=U9TAX7_RHIID
MIVIDNQLMETSLLGLCPEHIPKTFAGAIVEPPAGCAQFIGSETIRRAVILLLSITAFIRYCRPPRRTALAIGTHFLRPLKRKFHFVPFRYVKHISWISPVDYGLTYYAMPTKRISEESDNCFIAENFALILSLSTSSTMCMISSSYFNNTRQNGTWNQVYFT